MTQNPHFDKVYSDSHKEVLKDVSQVRNVDVLFERVNIYDD